MLVNKHRTDGSVAYIELTKGQETVIDIADLEDVLTRRWNAKPQEMGGYYAMSRYEGKTIYMHRFILDAPKGMYVDHVNHNTLDNRRSNLKICTNQENNENRNGAYKVSKTGVRGVSVHRLAPSKGLRKHKSNPDRLMYVFKCSCVTCKVCKYFPHTEGGLDAAKVFAEAHYAAMSKEE
jgi:HNH endonuclease